HGRTLGSLSLTPQPIYQDSFKPMLDGFKFVAANDINELQQALSSQTCAIFLELIQGEGGLNNLDESYVQAVAKLASKNKLLLIIDEVQTGVGRCGYFYLYQKYNIKPDLVTSSKGLGGGIPIAAVLAFEQCAMTLSFGDHGTTFGGNLLACSSALAVVNEVSSPHFLQTVKAKGNYFKEQIALIKGVQQITGEGLMIGIKLAEKIDVNDIVHLALQNNLLILKAKDKVRLLPPLNISYQEIDSGLSILKNIIEGAL
ncbi:MAG: aspartate aminotransferase family protein, partial [Bacilli bacterium]